MGRIPRVLKIKMQTNHAFWLFFALFQRPSPFQISSHKITITKIIQKTGDAIQSAQFTIIKLSESYLNILLFFYL